MIGSIRGTIVLKTDKFLIVEASGVGYKVAISPDTLSQARTLNQSKHGSGQEVGEDIFLFIHTHVREDSFDLYGFLEYRELEFFQMLLNVSGIGPKGALGILGIATIETLSRAIGAGDTSYLTKISGIGKKTAEKIVIELRDKMKDMMHDSGGEHSLQGEMDALEALKTLGYSEREAREALKNVTPDADINTKIREALKVLGGK